MVFFILLFALATVHAGQYSIQTTAGNPNEGYLMYSDTSIVGHVCADDFFGKTAKLACEHFGYPGLTSFNHIPAASVSHTEHDIVVETNCAMDHTKFEECEVEIDDIECGSSKVVQLTCTTLSPTMMPTTSRPTKLPTIAPTTDSPTKYPTTLPDHVIDLEDKIKECIDTDNIEKPEGCLTWLEYCNYNPDLVEEFCGGSTCSTVLQESQCRMHYINSGSSDGRKCMDLPTGCKTWLDYCNIYPDLKNKRCGGGWCSTFEEAESCRAHWPHGKKEGRWCPWNGLDKYDCTVEVNPDESSRAYSSVFPHGDDIHDYSTSMLDSLYAWSSSSNVAGQWMQVDLGKVMAVAGVVTQGRHDYPQWVKSYDVSYSVDGETYTYIDGTFTGNDDTETKVYNQFKSGSVSARYVRFHPTDWNNHISMRAAVIIDICLGSGATAMESKSSSTLALSALNVSQTNDISFMTVAIYGFALIGCAHSLSTIYQKASGSDKFKPISNQNEDEI